MCFGHLSHLKMTERTHSCSHLATLWLCRLIVKTLTSSERSSDARRLASRGCWKSYRSCRRLRGSERSLLDCQRWVQCRPQPCRCRHQAPSGLRCSPPTRLRYSVLLNLSTGEGGSDQCRCLSICSLGQASRVWRGTLEVRAGHVYCAHLPLRYSHYLRCHHKTFFQT